MVDRIAGEIVQTNTDVTSSETAIPATSQTNRRSILVINNGNATVFLGQTGVTTGNGYPLKAGAEKSFDLDEKVTLFGITATDTVDVRTLEGD